LLRYLKKIFYNSVAELRIVQKSWIHRSMRRLQTTQPLTTFSKNLFDPYF
jgi:hypothetical protein